jgi:hypothetical protein
VIDFFYKQFTPLELEKRILCRKSAVAGALSVNLCFRYAVVGGLCGKVFNVIQITTKNL